MHKLVLEKLMKAKQDLETAIDICKWLTTPEIVTLVNPDTIRRWKEVRKGLSYEIDNLTKLIYEDESLR